MINRKLTLAFATSLLALTATPALAQDTQRMEEVVEAEADTGKFMGAVLVAKGDEPMLNKAWGSADLEWDIANTTDTKYRIGSVTKQFTAVSILLLKEQGKLDLDAPISTYLEGTPETWSEVTVRNLIRHTSGIPSVTSLDEFNEIVRQPVSQDDLLAMYINLPLEFEPGSTWKYSNSGYLLLSRIIENLSEQPIGAFFQANLFDPLGMKATGFDITSQILPKRADGYSPTGDDVTVINAAYADMGIPSGAGALYSTTGDLHKWQRGLFGGQILSEESLAEYLTPSEHEAMSGSHYAHGVIVTKAEDNTVYWHSGGIQGFNSWLGYDADRQVTVAVLANLNGGAANKIGRQLFTLVHGGEVVLQADRVASEVDPADLAQYEGVFALAPTFKITMFVENGKLMAQATGQGANELFKESEDKFFLKVVDAQVRFNRDDSGKITSITVFQNGREIEGLKE